VAIEIANAPRASGCESGFGGASALWSITCDGAREKAACDRPPVIDGKTGRQQHFSYSRLAQHVVCAAGIPVIRASLPVASWV